MDKIKVLTIEEVNSLKKGDTLFYTPFIREFANVECGLVPKDKGIFERYDGKYIYLEGITGGWDLDCFLSWNLF